MASQKDATMIAFSIRQPRRVRGQVWQSFGDACGWRIPLLRIHELSSAAQGSSVLASGPRGTCGSAVAQGASRVVSGVVSKTRDEERKKRSQHADATSLLTHGYTIELGDIRFATRGPLAGKLKREQTPRVRLQQFLSIEQALDLIEVFVMAENHGTPLNAHLTITFDGSGADDKDVERAIRLRQTLLRDIGKLLARRKHPTAFIYTMEAAESGLHAHVLLHIDPLRWLEAKQALTELLTRRTQDLGMKPRIAAIRGTPWKVFAITPPQREGAADAAPGVEDRLRMLGYLLKGVDPAALVETTAGVVPFADILRFYLQSDVKPQGMIKRGRRAGRAQHLQTKSGVDPLSWIAEVNAMCDPWRRLPGPEFLAAQLGPCSPEPDPAELAERAWKVAQLRQACQGRAVVAHLRRAA